MLKNILKHFLILHSNFNIRAIWASKLLKFGSKLFYDNAFDIRNN